MLCLTAKLYVGARRGSLHLEKTTSYRGCLRHKTTLYKTSTTAPEPHTEFLPRVLPSAGEEFSMGFWSRLLPVLSNDSPVSHTDARALLPVLSNDIPVSHTDASLILLPPSAAAPRFRIEPFSLRSPSPPSAPAFLSWHSSCTNRQLSGSGTPQQYPAGRAWAPSGRRAPRSAGVCASVGRQTPPIGSARAGAGEDCWRTCLTRVWFHEEGERTGGAPALRQRAPGNAGEHGLHQGGVQQGVRAALMEPFSVGRRTPP